MYKKDGKSYVVKLNDFAAENGVSVRTVQKKLTAERYKTDLEGEFIRTSADGTWLTESGAEFLKSTLKSKAVGFVGNESYERKIAELERELFETQKEYTSYVKNATPLLQRASEQLALAERSGEYKERIEVLEAQNGDLSRVNEELGQKVAQAEKTAENANLELERERQRRITFKEYWQRRKNKE